MIFPKWKYHKIEGAKLIQTLEAEQALGSDWKESPAEFDTEEKVETPKAFEASQEEPAPKRRGRPKKGE